MSGLWQDLRYSVRALQKAPGFAVIAVVTLALGMAVNTTIFSVVNGVLLRPLPVPNPDQMVVLALTQAGTAGVQPFSYPDYQDLRAQTSGLGDIFAYELTLEGLIADGKGDHCVIARVTGNYFSTLGVRPLAGRLIRPTEGQTPGADPVIVLGYSYWQKRFGADAGVVGKQVEITGHSFRVIGIVPKQFHGTYAMIETDAYVPLSAAINEQGLKDIQDQWTKRGDRSLTLLARLNPGANLRQAQTSLNLVAGRLASQYPDVDKGISVQVYPEKLARPTPDPDNSILRASIAFMVLAGLVLLVACFNIANVLLVRATTRQREMAIRASLGAGRLRLVRQQLTESLVLAVLGGSAGLLLSSWAAGFLASVPLGTDLPIQFDFHADSRVLLFAAIVVLLTATVVGIIPAVRVARTSVSSVLHEGGRGSSDGLRRRFARNSLVAAQVAGSLLLLIVAGLFVRSLSKTGQINLGFNPDNVLNVAVDVQQVGYDESHGRQFFRELVPRLQALPGVAAVGQTFSVPMGYVSERQDLNIEGHPTPPGQQPPQVAMTMVDTQYFKVLQIRLLHGREFTDGDTEKSPQVAIINEAMAKKFWPTEDPIGKRFAFTGDPNKPLQIVGVVQTAKNGSPIEEPKPFFYVPLDQNYVPMHTILIRTLGPPDSVRLEVEGEIQQLAPSLALQVQTMNESLQGANGFLFFHLGAQITATMGLLGLILAVVGVYSVVSYAAAQRTHEIGIRMALGAEPRDVLRLVLNQGLVVVGIGVALGLAVTFAGTRAVASLLIGISPTDPVTYVAVVALLASVALLACWIPARRAMRVDPLVALRYE